jgi:hypothetical protein
VCFYSVMTGHSDGFFFTHGVFTVMNEKRYSHLTVIVFFWEDRCQILYHINKNNLYSTMSLLPVQEPEVNAIVNILVDEDAGAIASVMGSGKTYEANAICQILGKRPLIGCPKAIIPDWIRVCNLFNVKPLGIFNYELIHSGKYYRFDSETNTIIQKAEICPFIRKVELTDPTEIHEAKQEIESLLSQDERDRYGVPSNCTAYHTPHKFVFSNLPDDTLIIYDEAHKMKNYLASITRLLLATRNVRSIHNQKIPTLLLTATLCQSEEFFRPFGVFFGLYERMVDMKRWLSQQRQIHNCNNNMQIIHRALFPRFAHRLSTRDLINAGSIYPRNIIQANCYPLENSAEIQALYLELEELEEAAKHRQEQEEKEDIWIVKILRIRQRIELLKIPLFVNESREHITLIPLINHSSPQKSVVIFCNYRETMAHLSEQLNQMFPGVPIYEIQGSQNAQQRQESIASFQQSARSCFMLAQFQSGSLGVSLHDLSVGGLCPRVSLFNVTNDALALRQGLGRIARLGATSVCLQKIMYVGKTIEEEMCFKIQCKLDNIDTLNDGDLSVNIDQIQYTDPNALINRIAPIVNEMNNYNNHYVPPIRPPMNINNHNTNNTNNNVNSNHNNRVTQPRYSQFDDDLQTAIQNSLTGEKRKQPAQIEIVEDQEENTNMDQSTNNNTNSNSNENETQSIIVSTNSTTNLLRESANRRKKLRV